MKYRASYSYLRNSIDLPVDIWVLIIASISDIQRREMLRLKLVSTTLRNAVYRIEKQDRDHLYEATPQGVNYLARVDPVKVTYASLTCPFLILPSLPTSITLKNCFGAIDFSLFPILSSLEHLTIVDTPFVSLKLSTVPRLKDLHVSGYLGFLQGRIEWDGARSTLERVYLHSSLPLLQNTSEVEGTTSKLFSYPHIKELDICLPGVHRVRSGSLPLLEKVVINANMTMFISSATHRYLKHVDVNIQHNKTLRHSYDSIKSEGLKYVRLTKIDGQGNVKAFLRKSCY